MLVNNSMDKNEFRARLEAVAVIKDKKPPRSPNSRPAIEYITEIDELGEEYQRAVEIKDNPTLGFELIKLKEQHRLCELGCGDVVTNQVIERRHCESPKPHWRTRCGACNAFVSPTGEEFIRGGHAIQQAYLRFFRTDRTQVEEDPKETVTKTFKNIDRSNGQEYTETVTNNSIIRRYK